MAGATSPGCDILNLELGETEAADGDRPKALDLDGWTTVQDVRPWVEGECALLARDDVWEVVRWQAYEVAPDLGPGNKVTALMVLLRHIETGRTLLIGVVHLPSAVEGKWDSGRAMEYRRAVIRWRRNRPVRVSLPVCMNCRKSCVPLPA